MQSDRFRPLLTSKGPYASVYFDVSRDSEDAAAQNDLRWRALRERLEELDADSDVIGHLERAIVDGPLAVGQSGRTLVATADGVLLDEHVGYAPAAPEARLSTLPYVLPVVRHGREVTNYLVVAVDHAGADITVVEPGHTGTETIDGSGHPVHHATGAETPGYKDPQRRSDEAGRKNLRAVADRLTQLIDSRAPEVLFVVGEVQSRAGLLAELPDRGTERAVELQVGARGSGIDDTELQHAIDQEFLRRRVGVIDDAAQRFQSGRGHDPAMATEGLDGVCAALRAGAVETLIVGDVGDTAVLAGDDLTTVAPNPNVLSELGTAPTQTLRADEALPMAAIMTGAAIVSTDERISPTDGVAAILRYPLP
ncbi:Rv2629 family ribosome hibernation factor [Mycolicibacterium thermoresistibile]